MIYQNIGIKIYLASCSPRRKALLSSIGIEFEQIEPCGEERTFKFKSPRYYVEKKALLKSEETLKRYATFEGCLITADTIVVRKKRIIEKPSNEEEALKILSSLEGKWHSVFTAYCITLINNNEKIRILRSFRTKVKFKHLNKKEILNYIATKEPLDKAGAYAAQGFGSFMIESIEGSFTNVVGLPLSQVTEDLLKLKVIKVR
ncbi:MAG: nucleoside triphosphate pyrophosphatase [bacterium]